MIYILQEHEINCRKCTNRNKVHPTSCNLKQQDFYEEVCRDVRILSVINHTTLVCTPYHPYFCNLFSSLFYLSFSLAQLGQYSSHDDDMILVILCGFVQLEMQQLVLNTSSQSVCYINNNY